MADEKLCKKSKCPWCVEKNETRGKNTMKSTRCAKFNPAYPIYVTLIDCPLPEQWNRALDGVGK